MKSRRPYWNNSTMMVVLLPIPDLGFML